MSISQASSADRVLIAAVLSMETKSSTSAMSKWSNLCFSARDWSWTGQFGVTARTTSACIG